MTDGEIYENPKVLCVLSFMDITKIDKVFKTERMMVIGKSC